MLAQASQPVTKQREPALPVPAASPGVYFGHEGACFAVILSGSEGSRAVLRAPATSSTATSRLKVIVSSVANQVSEEYRRAA